MAARLIRATVREAIREELAYESFPMLHKPPVKNLSKQVSLRCTGSFALFSVLCYNVTCFTQSALQENHAASCALPHKVGLPSAHGREPCTSKLAPYSVLCYNVLGRHAWSALQNNNNNNNKTLQL